jgi:thiamine pyrophosphokinase
MIDTIIFANGDALDGPMVRHRLAQAQNARILAADGGAHNATVFGFVPDRVVGDMDSLSDDDLQRLTAQGVDIVRHPAEKDENDLELALRDAVEHDAREILVIGAVGDRQDQTLANITLMALPSLQGRTVRLVAGKQEMQVVGAGTHTIEGSTGDTLSLLPLGGTAENVHTSGLYYPLNGESLHFGPARGVSNVLTGDIAQITLSAGWLLLVHTIGRA